MKLTLIDWVNKTFGGLFGLGKGIFLTAVLLWIWTAILPKPEFMRASKMMPMLDQVDDFISRQLPPDWKQKLKSLTPTPLPTTPLTPTTPQKKSPTEIAPRNPANVKRNI